MFIYVCVTEKGIICINKMYKILDELGSWCKENFSKGFMFVVKFWDEINYINVKKCIK